MPREVQVVFASRLRNVSEMEHCHFRAVLRRSCHNRLEAKPQTEFDVPRRTSGRSHSRQSGSDRGIRAAELRSVEDVIGLHSKLHVDTLG